MPEPMPTPAFQLRGSRVGSHFIDLYRTCPMKWFNSYIRPHPSEGGAGLESVRTSPALLFGWAMHEALADYYRSGWQDGRYNVESAVKMGQLALHHRSKEFDDVDQLQAECIRLDGLMRKYHDFYGPGGVVVDYPNLRIAVDPEGEPLIEREFECELGYENYHITSRFDGVCWFNGYLYILEHKTTAASRLGRLFQQMGMNTQASCQAFILRHAFNDWPINGILVNALVKDRSSRSKEPPFSRNIASRSAADLEKFRVDTIRTLRHIEQDVQEYNRLVDSGMEVDDAARMVFQYHPKACVEFSACSFLPMCKAPGYESAMAGRFRSRAKTFDWTPMGMEE